MANTIAEKELKQLKEIKKELEEIKDRTANPRRTFFNGIIYGAGAFVGGILAVAFIGWFLSVLGIVPGLTEIVEYVQSLIDRLPAVSKTISR